jgi:hypothetical protein
MAVEGYVSSAGWGCMFMSIFGWIILFFSAGIVIVCRLEQFIFLDHLTEAQAMKHFASWYAISLAGFLIGCAVLRGSEE